MSAIVVSVHFAILSKHILLDFLLEFLLGDEIVFPAMDFSLSGPTCGITDAQFEEIRVFGEQFIDESALNRSRITLPTPEQPVMTRGLCLTISLW